MLPISLASLALLLAMTMQGEVAILGNDTAALAVAEVAMNRASSSKCFGDDICEVLVTGFYGWRAVSPSDVNERYLRLARQFLDGEHEWDHNALYMLSADDCRRLGVDTGDAVKSFRRGRWAVYLFEEWLGK